jgi:hypothetical protein
MAEVGGPGKALDGEVMTSNASASVDLVPITPTARSAPKRPLTRPDAGFVTQLIATATLAPQTRILRRGTLADAREAYAARPQERRGVARRTRQII